MSSPSFIHDVVRQRVVSALLGRRPVGTDGIPAENYSIGKLSLGRSGRINCSAENSRLK